MSANLTLRVVEDLDGEMFGTQAVTGVAASSGNGRSIILDGIDDYGTNADTGTGVPAAQSGWRFMVRVRGANLNTGSNRYICRDSAAAVLTIQSDSNSILAFVGPAADSTGAVTPNNTSDFILLIRADPASTEVSMETWNLDGSNRVGNRNTAASASATNFQNRTLTVGASTGGSNFFPGKLDKVLFTSGAGTYSGSAPDVLGTTGNIMNWTFDSDSGSDTSGNGVNLTLNGSPVFEDTP